MKQLKLILLLFTATVTAKAQNAYMHNLDKLISINVKQQPIADVLNMLGKAGDFYFSYNGALFKQDSVVTVQYRNVPVRDLLDDLFHSKVDYKETGQYVILRYAANHLTIEPENIIIAENLYLISGFIVDTQTGKKVKQASVYEKELLQSALTDEEGHFTLRFKGEHKQVILTASKENYRDTALVFLADIKVKPQGYKDPESEFAGNIFNSIEKSGIGRFFISSKQRLQSLNIPNFFANSPFQASLLPGLSSHGMMSSQVVNKGSLNVLGGYTAGVNGFEIAGLFNISKGNVLKFQAAGLLNAVGGSVKGVQIAGILNEVRTNIEGFQAAGLINHVNADAQGFQVAGLANLVSKKMKGTQVSGLVNLSGQYADGIQIAGLINLAAQKLKGIQISGLFNYAKEMTGLQIGLINASQANTGYSIGLINYVHHGYHKISLSSNEIINTNLAYKMGNSKLYNIIFAGKNFANGARLETGGIGFGHDILFSNTFSIATEITSQYIYLGNWDYSNLMNRFQANLQFQISKGFTLFGGPVYSIYTSDAPLGSSAKGYKQQIYPDKHHNFSPSIKGWLGWNVGITVF